MVTRMNPATGMPPVAPSPVEDTDVNPLATSNTILTAAGKPDVATPSTINLPNNTVSAEPPRLLGSIPVSYISTVVNAANSAARNYPAITVPATPERPAPSAEQAVNQATQIFRAIIQRLWARRNTASASGVIGQVITPPGPDNIMSRFIQNGLKP